MLRASSCGGAEGRGLAGRLKGREESAAKDEQGDCVVQVFFGAQHVCNADLLEINSVICSPLHFTDLLEINTVSYISPPKSSLFPLPRNYRTV